MRNLRKLTALVVPSGNSSRQDLERLWAVGRHNPGNTLPYVLSGVGPDLNRARFDNKGYISDAEGLDVHADLYDNLVRRFHEAADEAKYRPFGVDIQSTTSRENLMCSFPPGQQGAYIMGSYPLHNLKFKLQEWKLKRRGLMSKDVKIEYISTKSWREQTGEEWFHGVFSLMKALIS